MGFLFIYLNTLILLRKKGYLITAPNQSIQLPDTYYIRCRRIGTLSMASAV